MVIEKTIYCSLSSSKLLQGKTILLDCSMVMLSSLHICDEQRNLGYLYLNWNVGGLWYYSRKWKTVHFLSSTHTARAVKYLMLNSVKVFPPVDISCNIWVLDEHNLFYNRNSLYLCDCKENNHFYSMHLHSSSEATKDKYTTSFVFRFLIFESITMNFCSS